MMDLHVKHVLYQRQGAAVFATLLLAALPALLAKTDSQKTKTKKKLDIAADFCRIVSLCTTYCMDIDDLLPRAQAEWEGKKGCLN